MAQNPYNNYIKRKAKTNVGVNPTIAPKPNNNPGVGFKKRVVGNLGGNTLTPATQTQKTQNTSSQTTNQYTTPPENNISPSNNVQPANNTNTQPITPTPVTNAPVASQANTVPTETVTPLQVDNAPMTYATRSIGEIEQVNEIADEIIENPAMMRIARSSNKTPQEYAKEIYEQQKAQLQKDWELKQQELKLQQEQAQKSFQTSVDDTDKKYGETVDKLNLNRYEQMQDLSVSATNRGLQYSPQQLGLENVANINHNKNLAEASKERNEMLTQLNTKLMELQAQLTLGSQNAVNEYNKALASLSSDYTTKLMDWSYDKQMTDEERAWQEAQAQKDREWQEKMDKANKEWQSAENALDRKNGRSGSSYGGYGYSSSWKGNSGWKNYKGSGGSSYGDYNVNTIDFDDLNQANVYFDEFKKNSTDVYNAPALRAGGLSSINERGSVYSELVDPTIRYAQENGASDEYINKMIDTRDTALKHMYNRAYGQDTNSLVDLGNGVIAQSRSPLRDDYIARVKANNEVDRAKFFENLSYNDERRKEYTNKLNNPLVQHKNKIGNNTVDMIENIRKNGATKTVNTMKNKTSNTSKTKESVKKSVSNIKKSTSNAKKNSKTSVSKAKSNVKKSTSNAKSNIKKSVSKSKSNVKKSTTNAKSNIKKSVSKSKANTKKSTSNALKNLKKNISKLFGR